LLLAQQRACRIVNHVCPAVPATDGVYSTYHTVILQLYISYFFVISSACRARPSIDCCAVGAQLSGGDGQMWQCHVVSVRIKLNTDSLNKNKQGFYF